MNHKKLAKLKREHETLRNSPQNARALESIARKLGRSISGNGKHPMWVSTQFNLRPLSIPHHGGRDIPNPTRNSILDQLEEDMICWDEYLENKDD